MQLSYCAGIGPQCNFLLIIFIMFLICNELIQTLEANMLNNLLSPSMVNPYLNFVQKIAFYKFFILSTVFTIDSS
jgi:hypothetical protein